MKIKQTIITSLSVLFCISLFAFKSNATQSSVMRVENMIAVMDIELGVGVPPELRVPLTQAIIDELVNTGKFYVIDRANRDKILKEQGLQLSECVNEECRVKAGRLLGVGKLLVGYLYKIGKVYFASLQIINVETGQIEDSVKHKCKCEMEELLDVIPSIARQMLTGEKRVLTSKAPSTGTLVIESEPSGASIKIDGKDTGKKTPASIKDLAPGSHTVVARLNDMKATRNVNVQAGKKLRISLKLERPKSNVKIVSNVKGATVYVDGSRAGQTPFEGQLTYGKHTITVKESGYGEVSKEISIQKPSIKLSFELKKTISGQGILDISTSPAGAKIYLNGKYYGKTPRASIKVKPGKVQVVLVKKGYERVDKSIYLDEGETRTIMEVLRKQGGKISIEKNIHVRKKGSLWKKILGWSGAILGAAMVGVGGWQLSLAAGDKSDADYYYDLYLNSVRQSDIDNYRSMYQDAASWAKRETYIGYSMVGVGAVAIGMGIWGIIEGEKAKDARVSENIHVFPAIGKNGFSLSLGCTF